MADTALKILVCKPGEQLPGEVLKVVTFVDPEKLADNDMVLITNTVLQQEDYGLAFDDTGKRLIPKNSSESSKGV